MHRLAFAVTMLVALRAHASECAINYGTTTAGDVPLGCPLVIYVTTYDDQPPTFTATRNGEIVDIATTATAEDSSLAVEYTNYACDGSVSEDYTHVEPYTRYTVQLVDAQVGDVLHGPAIYGSVVQPAGACPAETAPPMEYCTGLNSGYPCQDDQGSGSDDSGGCQASSSASGLPLALALVGLVGFSRRRRTPAARD